MQNSKKINTKFEEKENKMAYNIYIMFAVSGRI